MTEINSKYGIKEDSFDISLRDLAAPLFRRKRVLFLTFIGVFVVAALIGLRRLHHYESHMAILVSRERADPLVSTEPTNQSGVTPALTDEEVNSEAELFKSRDLLEKAVVANGLQKPHHSFLDVFRKPPSEADRVAKAVQALASQIKVETPTRTNLIEVTYSSKNPATAYGVLNSLSNLYLEKHAAVHRPAGSYQFFAEQAENYKNALLNSEARLQAFAQTQGVADPDEERRDMAQQLSTAVGQAHNTEQAIAADEQHIQSDQEQIKVVPHRSPTAISSRAADKLVGDLQASLLVSQTKRTQLLLKYEPNYPLVKEADQEIAETEAAIAKAKTTEFVDQTTDRDPTFELLREDLAKTKADLEGQRASLSANRRSIDSIQNQMVKLVGQSLQQADLQREAKADEDNYLLYLSKREQERTSDALDRTRIENVAIAVPPAIPALPTEGPGVLLLAAFVIAVILSLATAYTVDYFDPSFHTPGQVIDMLGIPVVIAVPKRTA